MNYKSYTLVTLDVWGTGKGDWAINAAYYTSRIYHIMDIEDEDEIRQMLIRGAEIMDDAQINIEGDEQILYIYDANDDCPLLQLHLTKEK